jgi:hypothetical protein
MGDLLTFLSQEDLINIRTDAREAVLNFESILYGQPPSRPISFIYRRLVSQTMNLSTGAQTPTWEDTRVSGFGGIQVMFAKASNGITAGDPCVMFDPTLITAPPQDQDRVLLRVTMDGHVGLETGSDTVSGIDTQFVKHGVQGGDVLIDCDVISTKLEIESVQSETELTLVEDWTGAMLPYLKYEIFRSHIITDRKVDPMGALIRLGLKRAGA